MRSILRYIIDSKTLYQITRLAFIRAHLLHFLIIRALMQEFCATIVYIFRRMWWSVDGTTEQINDRYKKKMKITKMKQSKYKKNKIKRRRQNYQKKFRRRRNFSINKKSTPGFGCISPNAILKTKTSDVSSPHNILTGQVENPQSLRNPWPGLVVLLLSVSSHLLDQIAQSNLLNSLISSSPNRRSFSF